MRGIYEFSSRVMKGAGFALLLAALIAAISQNGIANSCGGPDEEPCGTGTAQICSSCSTNTDGQCVTAKGIAGGGCSRDTGNKDCEGNPILDCKDCTCQNPPGSEDPCACY